MLSKLYGRLTEVREKIRKIYRANSSLIDALGVISFSAVLGKILSELREDTMLRSIINIVRFAAWIGINAGAAHAFFEKDWRTFLVLNTMSFTFLPSRLRSALSTFNSWLWNATVTLVRRPATYRLGATIAVIGLLVVTLGYVGLQVNERDDCADREFSIDYALPETPLDANLPVTETEIGLNQYCGEQVEYPHFVPLYDTYEYFEAQHSLVVFHGDIRGIHDVCESFILQPGVEVTMSDGTWKGYLIKGGTAQERLDLALEHIRAAEQFHGRSCPLVAAA